MKKNASRGVAFTVLLFVLGAVAVQYSFHVFDAPLHNLYAYLSAADSILFNKMVLGISMGTVVFLIALLILPILAGDINTKSYFKNLSQGIVSSFIFFVTNSVYTYLEKLSRVYLLISILIVTILALSLIQILAKVHRKEEDRVEFKTANIAGVAAGLIFGILLQLGRIGFEMLKAGLKL